MADGVAEDVLVVCPALNSQLRTWLSDEDGARDAAQERLRCDPRTTSTAAGVNVRGEIGDGDPLQALEDALRGLPGRRDRDLDPPRGPSHWLERGVVEAARSRFDVPVTHVDRRRIRVAGGRSTPVGVPVAEGYLPATLDT